MLLGHPGKIAFLENKSLTCHSPHSAVSHDQYFKHWEKNEIQAETIEPKDYNWFVSH